MPTDRSDWPLLARTIARLAKPGDKGLGDVVQRYAAKFGGEEFKGLYKKLMGRECGCRNRQSKLNKRFPF